MIDAALLRGDGAVLMMLDLDRFRSVNEALGTAAGDALLAVDRPPGSSGRSAAAGRVMRLDGDRFVIVAPRGPDDDPAAVRALARRLLEAVAEPVVLDGRARSSTQASIGIVAGLSPDIPTPSLLMQADAALRRAKIEGRNRFALHGPAEAVAAAETSRLELDLPGALADGQLRLVYQPYVDLADGRVSGVEALVRWQHPVRGHAAPRELHPDGRGDRADPRRSAAGRSRPRSPPAARWPRAPRARGQHLAAPVPPAGLPRRGRRRARRHRLRRPSGSSSRSPRPC